MHFAAGVKYQRAALGMVLTKERERLDERGEDLPHGLRTAARQEEHGSLGVILQARLMVGLSKGMANESSIQLSVGVYRRLEREDGADAIQVTRHGEATLGLPSPQLRADVLDDGRLAEASTRQAGFAQFVSEAEIEARVIDQHDDLRLPLRGPSDDAREELPVERISRKDLHDAHGGERGHIHQQLGASGAQLRPAERDDAQTRASLE